MKKTKGLYRIVIQQEDGSWRDSGEGPFDTYREAEEFQKNEVGMQSEIVGGPPVPIVTYSTLLLDLPKEILLPLDPSPVDEIARCTVGDYLNVMEGTGLVVPDGSTTWLRAVLEDFDSVGSLEWRPE